MNSANQKTKNPVNITDEQFQLLKVVNELNKNDFVDYFKDVIDGFDALKYKSTDKIHSLVNSKDKKALTEIDELIRINESCLIITKLLISVSNAAKEDLDPQFFSKPLASDLQV